MNIFGGHCTSYEANVKYGLLGQIMDFAPNRSHLFIQIPGQDRKKAFMSKTEIFLLITNIIRKNLYLFF